MLTSFFGKSKPFNFILVSIYLIIGFFFYLFFKGNVGFGIPFLIKISLSLLTYLFLIFLLNFINKKNKLTKNNTYSILFFSAFIIMFSSVFEVSSVVLSNVFLLLALRRIISLPSEINTEKKILDASLWISVAALFNFWSILFFAVLFFAVFEKASKNYKYILIPFVGVFAVFTLTTVYYLLVNDSFLWFLDLQTSIGFDFSEYNSPQLLIAILFISILILISIIQKIFHNATIPLKEKSKNRLLLYILLIGIVVIFITPIKNGSEFIFLFAPLSILATSYIETTKKRWISETTLWITVLLPFLIYFL
ncbi:MAG: DUF6427 family protein [Flavobacteriaceae bacterium]|nr:DUF6427 family protein [Flavobacteriaceae bacterium]